MFDRIKEKVYEGGEMMTDAWKLRKHVIWDPRDMDKQVVDHAAKLLSNTMARTIRFFFKDEPEMLELADFVEMVNNWFDTLNSTKIKHLYPYKNSYGLHLERQRQVLFDFKNVVKNTKVMNKANEESEVIKYQPWQTAVLIVSSALPKLYNYLVDKYEITYLKTYRIGQDTVEQTFSILRSLGGNNPNMDSVNFIYRMERFCIGAGQKVEVEKANILFNHGAKTLTVARNNADLVEEEPTIDEESTVDEEPTVDKEPTAKEVSAIDKEPEKSLGPFEVIFWADGVDKFLELKKYKASLDLIAEPQPGTSRNLLPMECETAEPQPETSRTLLPMEREGFVNFGGYISRKHDPSLATKANEPYDEEEFVVSDWINAKNLGSLGTPKKSFNEDLIEMDKEFRKFHRKAPGKFAPHDLSREPNVTKDFAKKLIDKFPEYPEKLLKCFAVARTHFRKRYQIDALKFQESFRSRRKKMEYEYAKGDERKIGKAKAKKTPLEGVKKKKTQVKSW